MLNTFQDIDLISTHLLNNFYWSFPELFLFISITLLLGWGVVFIRYDFKKIGHISIYKHFYFLTFLIGILTIFLLINQLLIILQTPNFINDLFAKGDLIYNFKTGSQDHGAALNTFHAPERDSSTSTRSPVGFTNSAYLQTINIFNGFWSINYFIVIIKIITIFSLLTVLNLGAKEPFGWERIRFAASPVRPLNDSKGLRPKGHLKVLYPDAEGYYLLIILSLLGILLILSSNDIIMIYLSIETISLSLYILASIRRTGQYSTEAGLRYFILGALSSGLLLFGGTLIYLITGLTNLNDISYFISNLFIDAPDNLIIREGQYTIIGLELGILFIIIAFLFKLAAGPFHMWAPDVYEGAPTIITAFFAIVPKLGIFIIFLKLILGTFSYNLFPFIIQPVLCLSALMSIIIGSLGAFNQNKIKRLIAYSAISHIGYILIGIIPGTINSIQSSFIYFLIYIIMSINTFALIFSFYSKNPYAYSNLMPIKEKKKSPKGIIEIIEPQVASRTEFIYETNPKHETVIRAPQGTQGLLKGERNGNKDDSRVWNEHKRTWHSVSNYITELNGLSRKEPILAITFAISLLSIAGIPPLAGFFSKYLVFLSFLDFKENLNIIIAVFAILFTVVGAYYYIRIIQVMFFRSQDLKKDVMQQDIRVRSVPQKSISVLKHKKQRTNTERLHIRVRGADLLFKDLRDIALSLKAFNHYENNYSETASDTIRHEIRKARTERFIIPISLSIILGGTLFIILTFIFYPNPILIISSTFIQFFLI